jgi:hypothetical protein
MLQTILRVVEEASRGFTASWFSAMERFIAEKYLEMPPTIRTTHVFGEQNFTATAIGFAIQEGASSDDKVISFSRTTF